MASAQQAAPHLAADAQRICMYHGNNVHCCTAVLVSGLLLLVLQLQL
jgi:hypothetical protein